MKLTYPAWFVQMWAAGLSSLSFLAHFTWLHRHLSPGVQVTHGWILLENLFSIPLFYSTCPLCAKDNRLAFEWWAPKLDSWVWHRIWSYIFENNINGFIHYALEAHSCLITLIPLSYYMVLRSVNTSQMINSIVDRHLGYFQTFYYYKQCCYKYILNASVHLKELLKGRYLK